MKQSDIARSRIGNHGKRYIPWDNLTSDEKVARWENVLRVMESLTPKQRKHEFEMSLWVAIASKDLPKGVTPPKRACGTTACAAGYCSLDPVFRKAGYFAKPVFKTKEWLDDGEPELTDAREIGSYTAHNGNVDEEDFFGDAGTSNIFHNGDPRSVEVVINEIKRHIIDLKIEALRDEQAKLEMEEFP